MVVSHRPPVLAGCAPVLDRYPLMSRLSLMLTCLASLAAALFASAERQRGRCGSDGTLTGRAGAHDWITGLNEPELRGRLKEGG